MPLFPRQLHPCGLRIPAANPRNKIGLKETPVPADTGSWNGPATDLRPYGIGMKSKERRRAAEREDEAMFAVRV